jgi:hypothetical protein
MFAYRNLQEIIMYPQLTAHAKFKNNFAVLKNKFTWQKFTVIYSD